MSRTSRFLMAAAAVVLVAAFVFPLWTIDLEAPQYPEGIGMRIHLHTIRGAKPNDLDNINGCLLYTSPSPRDRTRSRMPSSA